MDKRLKTKLWITTIIFLVIGLIETAYFGWNLTSQSGAEFFFDVLIGAGWSISIVYVWYSHEEE
jgi:hypothetical protein